MPIAAAALPSPAGPRAVSPLTASGATGVAPGHRMSCVPTAAAVAPIPPAVQAGRGAEGGATPALRGPMRRIWRMR